MRVYVDSNDMKLVMGPPSTFFPRRLIARDPMTQQRRTLPVRYNISILDSSETED